MSAVWARARTEPHRTANGRRPAATGRRPGGEDGLQARYPPPVPDSNDELPREGWWTEMEDTLRARAASEPGAHPTSRCSVAAVLHFDGPPRVLMMQRTVRSGDPWSGQVSLPGGKWKRDDVDLVATAVREAEEEVGIQLAPERELVARLETQRTHIGGVDVTPFVFRVNEVPETRTSAEAASVFWLPLERAASGELDGEFRWDQGQVIRRMPCWNYEGRVVWGLTHRILSGLLDLAGRG